MGKPSELAVRIARTWLVNRPDHERGLAEIIDAEIAPLVAALRAMLDSDDDDAVWMIDPDPYPMACAYCGRDYHKNDCPVTLAREALAAAEAS